MEQNKNQKTNIIQEFQIFAQNKGLYFDKNIIHLIFTAPRKAFMLRGPPGVGKTSLAHVVAEFLGAEVVFYQATPGTTEDDLLYKYIPSEESKSGVRITYGPLPLALELSQTKSTVLILDEFDKTRPSADALLLDFLQNYRVSLYVDNEKRVVAGKPENLWVFITSNDIREFSEPLLRRLVTIYLKPLPVSLIYDLLSRRFEKHIALLLTQIYTDTLNAGLRKPATVQELIELGELLAAGVGLPLSDLLKSIVIKYDDDWQKYTSYISTRQPYDFNLNSSSNSNDDNDPSIEEAYKPPKEEVEIRKEEKKEENKTSQLLEVLKRLVVKTPTPEPIRATEAKEVEEVTVRIEDNDFEAYTKVIQALRPEPTDDPAVFGKFIFRVDGVPVITSKEPLTLDEVRKMVNGKKVAGEYYFEEKEIMTSLEFIDEFINIAHKIRYYTKNRLFLEANDKKTTLLLDVTIKDVDGPLAIVAIRGYLKYDGSNIPWLFGHLSGIGMDNVKVALEKAISNAIWNGVVVLPKRYIDPLVNIDIAFMYSSGVDRNTVKNAVKLARVLKHEYGIPAIFTCDGTKYHYPLYFTKKSDKKIVEVEVYGELAKEICPDKIENVDIDDPRVDEVLSRL